MPVQKGIEDAFEVFAGKEIQNNWAEATNNVLRSVACLKGQRAIDALCRRIRGIFALRNRGSSIDPKQLGRKHRAAIVLNRIFYERKNVDHMKIAENIHVKT